MTNKLDEIQARHDAQMALPYVESLPYFTRSSIGKTVTTLLTLLKEAHADITKLRKSVDGYFHALDCYNVYSDDPEDAEAQMELMADFKTELLQDTD